MQDESGQSWPQGAVICGKVLSKAERILAEQAASHYRWPWIISTSVEHYQPSVYDLAMAERALFGNR